MNAFVVAATALIVLIVPLGYVMLRERPIDGLVALSLTGTISTLAMLCLAEGLHRSFAYAVAVVSGVLSIVGSLVFARFLGRWL